MARERGERRRGKREEREGRGRGGGGREGTVCRSSRVGQFCGRDSINIKYYIKFYYNYYYFILLLRFFPPLGRMLAIAIISGALVLRAINFSGREGGSALQPVVPLPPTPHMYLGRAEDGSDVGFEDLP